MVTSHTITVEFPVGNSESLEMTGGAEHVFILVFLNACLMQHHSLLKLFSFENYIIRAKIFPK